MNGPGVSASAQADAAGRALLPSDKQTPSFERASSSELERSAEAINSAYLKRVFDVVVASVLIVAFLPAMLLIALAIVIDSPGSSLFRQQRYGRGRKVFWVYKLRTMRVAESTGSFTQARLGDERVTRLGRLLRRTSIDELPQLFNVLKGEMSLVGPRPHAVFMDDLYSRSFHGYSDRHLVRPGMTGLAQIHGHRGPTLTPAAVSERFYDDRTYIQTWSFWLDLKIIALTPLALISENAV